MAAHTSNSAHRLKWSDMRRRAHRGNESVQTLVVLGGHHVLRVDGELVDPQRHQRGPYDAQREQGLHALGVLGAHRTPATHRTGRDLPVAQRAGVPSLLPRVTRMLGEEGGQLVEAAVAAAAPAYRIRPDLLGDSADLFDVGAAKVTARKVRRIALIEGGHYGRAGVAHRPRLVAPQAQGALGASLIHRTPSRCPRPYTRSYRSVRDAVAGSAPASCRAVLRCGVAGRPRSWRGGDAA